MHSSWRQTESFVYVRDFGSNFFAAFKSQNLLNTVHKSLHLAPKCMLTWKLLVIFWACNLALDMLVSPLVAGTTRSPCLLPLTSLSRAFDSRLNGPSCFRKHFFFRPWEKRDFFWKRRCFAWKVGADERGGGGEGGAGEISKTVRKKEVFCKRLFL